MICRVYRNVCIKVLVLTCALIAGVSALHAQNTNADLLRSALKRSRPDTDRVNLQLKLSEHYAANSKTSARYIDSALAYAAAANKLSKTLLWPKGDGNSDMALAKAYVLKKDSTGCNTNLRAALTVFLKNNLYREAAETYLKCEEYYQFFGGTDLSVRAAWYEKALSQFKKTAAYHRQEATLKILGDFYQLQGNYPKALQCLQRALVYVDRVPTIDKEALYDLLGSVYVMMGNLHKALEYGFLAIKMAEQGKDSSMQLCAVYNRVGITYYQMKQPLRAKVFFEKSLAVAVRYNDTETQINEYVNISHVLISLGRFKDCVTLLNNVIKKYPAKQMEGQTSVYHSLLKCYTRLKDFDKARIYADLLEEASIHSDQHDNDQQITQSLLAEYYVATRQDHLARKHLAFLKRISAMQHNPVALAIAYTLTANLDSAQHKYASAYSNYLRASALKDSVWNANRTKQTSHLQILFDTEKKDEQLRQKEDRIKLLNTQARLHQIDLEQERSTQRLIAGGAVLLAVLLILSYRGYRSKQRVNAQLQKQSADIEQKNITLTNLVQEKEHLLKEKEWLMKEIHHRVKNNLQIVISLLSSQSNYLDNDVAYNAIRESQHRMQSISLIHQKLYQSDNLALVNISAYITDLVDYLRDSFDTGTRIEFDLDIVSAEFDVTRAVPLGLILNEAITNSIKYAFPDGRKGTISISLKPTGANSFLLIIADNGVGLPAAANIGTKRSLGMSLMRGLSKQLGGDLKIDGSKGITIAVTFINETLLQAI